MRNDANSSKAIWCRFSIDDFNTAKVKIIHIRGGKYRVIEDREEGKYVGKVREESMHRTWTTSKFRFCDLDWVHVRIASLASLPFLELQFFQIILVATFHPTLCVTLRYF